MTNYYAPDGYRYGVMHNDGSVTEIWNGRTQRERAEEAAAKWLEESRGLDNISLARKDPDGTWQRMHKYRCNHCKKTTERFTDKRWITSWCDSQGKMTRLWRVE